MTSKLTMTRTKDKGGFTIKVNYFKDDAKSTSSQTCSVQFSAGGWPSCQDGSWEAKILMGKNCTSTKLSSDYRVFTSKFAIEYWSCKCGALLKADTQVCPCQAK